MFDGTTQRSHSLLAKLAALLRRGRLWLVRRLRHRDHAASACGIDLKMVDRYLEECKAEAEIISRETRRVLLNRLRNEASRSRIEHDGNVGSEAS